MADVVLSDGREITLNLYLVTHAEHVRMAKNQTTAEEDCAILSRVAGLTPVEFDNLPQPDWRQIVKRYWQKSIEPLSDPN